MIRAIPFTAVPIGYGPFAEFYRVVGRPGQGRCDNRHRRGAAPGLANRAGGAIHGICPPLIQLIVVNDLPAAISKDHALIALTAALNVVLFINAELLVVAILFLKILHHAHLIAYQPLGQHGERAGNQVQDKGNQEQQAQNGGQNENERPSAAFLIGRRPCRRLCQQLCRQRINRQNNTSNQPISAPMSASIRSNCWRIFSRSRPALSSITNTFFPSSFSRTETA